MRGGGVAYNCVKIGANQCHVCKRSSWTVVQHSYTIN